MYCSMRNPGSFRIHLLTPLRICSTISNASGAPVLSIHSYLSLRVTSSATSAGLWLRRPRAAAATARPELIRTAPLSLRICCRCLTENMSMVAGRVSIALALRAV